MTNLVPVDLNTLSPRDKEYAEEALNKFNNLDSGHDFYVYGYTEKVEFLIQQMHIGCKKCDIAFWFNTVTREGCWCQMIYINSIWQYPAVDFTNCNINSCKEQQIKSIL